MSNRAVTLADIHKLDVSIVCLQMFEENIANRIEKHKGPEWQKLSMQRFSDAYHALAPQLQTIAQQIQAFQEGHVMCHEQLAGAERVRRLEELEKEWMAVKGDYRRFIDQFGKISVEHRMMTKEDVAEVHEKLKAEIPGWLSEGSDLGDETVQLLYAATFLLHPLFCSLYLNDHKRARRISDADDSLRSFLDRNTHPEQLEALERLLNARPACSTPQKSDLEATKELRYEYALQIQAQVRKVPSSHIKVGKDENGEDKFEPFRLDATHVSIILLGPMSALEEGGWLDCKLRSVELYHNLQLVVNLVKHCSLSPRNVTSHTNSSKSSPSPRPKGIQPNEDLDDVYFTSAVMGALYAFFSEDTATELRSLLANTAELGCSDKYWNMLNMNLDLRHYWGQAYCGLYCKGIAPCEEPDESTDLITLESDDNEFMKMAERQIKYERDGSPWYNDTHGAPIAAGRVDMNILIESGHEFTITMPREDAEKCKLVLDLQWAIIQIAAMSGAAGYPDLLPNHHDWIKAELFRE
ncbi:unnamed protein product [Fusarium equiseti]|uniref:Uncharacterized protein n=1 Tax=Fusarium equiseti TaxID=61235 RepID=A0A8J2IQG2_FUSEQ|nr:unnamed protein product [Fusarium equiseti]